MISILKVKLWFRLNLYIQSNKYIPCVEVVSLLALVWQANVCAGRINKLQIFIHHLNNIVKKLTPRDMSPIHPS